MPILNYTTKVSPEVSIGQITGLLVRKGARSITSEFTEEGEIKAVSFVMNVGGFPVRYLLPANGDGVAAAMLRESPWKSTRQGPRTEYETKVSIRATWIAWRILKDWVEAQMALIESGQVEAPQVFMPYAMAENGRTMYELFTESNQKRLGTGE